MTSLLASLHSELHARPHPVFSGEYVVGHRAYLLDDPHELRRRAERIANELQAQLTIQTGHLLAWEWDRNVLRVEMHNEFARLTCIRPHPHAGRFTYDPWQDIPLAQLADLQDSCVALTRMDVKPSSTGDLDRADLEPIFGDHQFIGSLVSDGKAAVWSDFLPNSDGERRLLVLDFGLSPRRCGRLMQRLLDIEVYLHLSYVGLQAARKVHPDLVRFSQEIELVTADIADSSTPTAERSLLNRLGNVSAQLEHHRARTARRFSATAAYGELVAERLAELRERKIAGFQIISEFVGRRLAPGLRTVASIRANVDDLAQRVQRTAELLQARIDLTLADQNRSLLTSMDRRAALQIRLQETVEGLSVVVLSYYTVGLIKYTAGGSKAIWHAPDSDLVAGIAVPVVLFTFWLLTKRLRRKVHHSANQ